MKWKKRTCLVVRADFWGFFDKNTQLINLKKGNFVLMKFHDFR